MLRKLSKAEFCLRAEADLDEAKLQQKPKPKKKSQKQIRDELFRDYAKERYTTYLRGLRNGHRKRGT